MKKRILTLTLALCLAAALGTVGAWAEDKTVYDEAELVAAIESAQDGDTITLGEDISTEETVEIPAGKNIVLDLNGNDLTNMKNNYNRENPLNVIQVSGELTILDSTAVLMPSVNEDYTVSNYESGSIVGNDYFGTTVAAVNGGKVTIESGYIKSNNNLGVSAIGNIDPNGQAYQSQMIINGGYIHAQEFAATAQGNGAELTINNGVLVAVNNAAVAGNGTKTDTVDRGGTVININGGTVISNITTAGYIACGVYHPQQGQLNITGGTIVANGGVGVLMRAGTAEITGGTIIAKGDETTSGGVGDAVNDVGAYGVVYDLRPAYPGHVDGNIVTIGEDAVVNGAVGALDVIETNESDAPSYDEIVVTGGTFKAGNTQSNVSDYIQAGAALTQDGNGTIIAAPDANVVANVNNIGYDTLANAINAANDGDTVTLVKSVTENTAIEIPEGKDITLDLGGYTLTMSGTNTVYDTVIDSPYNDLAGTIINNGGLTITNGTINTNSNLIVSFGEVNVESSAVLEAGGNVISNVGGELNTSGSLTTTGPYNAIETYGGTVNVTGGRISALYDGENYNDGSGLAIFNRGYNTDQTGGAKVTISDGVIESISYAASTNNARSRGSNLTITGGTLTSHTTAVYWPSYDTLVIGVEGAANGPTITSTNGSAVEVCSGTLIVYGGTLNGGTEMIASDSIPTDQNWVDAFRNNTGSSGIGDAITIIASRASGYDSSSLMVQINGGTFTSSQNYGVRYMDCNLSVTGANAGDKITQEVTVDIIDGEFNGHIAAVDAEFVKDEDLGFISGGNFSDPVDKEYLDGKNAELYSVSNPDTPYSYYTDVAAAQAAAQPGDVVTDLTDVAADAEDKTITINYGDGTTKTITTKEGATVTLPAPERNGYTFGGWKYNNTVYKAGQVVTVSDDMAFTAIWYAIDVPDTYPITVTDTANGSVDVSYSNASKGSVITVTVDPDEGFIVGSVSVTSEDGAVEVTRVNSTTYSFVMPESAVTVSVNFVSGSAGFVDVPAGAWYSDAVAYVYANGLMQGTSAATFEPDAGLTRSMVWAVLARMDGETVSGTGWQSVARAWAVRSGVSDGTDPNGLITREQLVTMLWRFAGEPATDATLSGYSDAASVNAWATTAMAWAIDNGIITGVTDTTLVPQGTATRAQCAAILMRYDTL